MIKECVITEMKRNKTSSPKLLQRGFMGKLNHALNHLSPYLDYYPQSQNDGLYVWLRHDGGWGRTDVPIKYFYFVSIELSLYPLPFLKCGAKIQNIFVSNNISNVFL